MNFKFNILCQKRRVFIDFWRQFANRNKVIRLWFGIRWETVFDFHGLISDDESRKINFKPLVRVKNFQIPGEFHNLRICNFWRFKTLESSETQWLSQLWSLLGIVPIVINYANIFIQSDAFHITSDAIKWKLRSKPEIIKEKAIDFMRYYELINELNPDLFGHKNRRI